MGPQQDQDAVAVANVSDDESAIAKITEPFAPQISITFSSNTQGAAVEVAYPEGIEPDEKNILHVLGWYIANAFDTLLPVAINSWHAQRQFMLAQKAANAASATEIVTPSGRILGADSKPIDPSGATGD